MVDADQAGPGSSPALSPAVIVGRSAAYGLLLALPAALLNGWLAEQDPPSRGAQFATVVAVLVGYAIAGFAAGTNAPARPDRFGALAGIVAFVPVELVVIMSRLDRGDGVNVGGIIVFGFLAAILGLIGSRPGAARRAAKQKAQEGPS